MEKDMTDRQLAEVFPPGEFLRDELEDEDGRKRSLRKSLDVRHA